MSPLLAHPMQKLVPRAVALGVALPRRHTDKRLVAGLLVTSGLRRTILGAGLPSLAFCSRSAVLSGGYWCPGWLLAESSKLDARREPMHANPSRDSGSRCTANH